MKKLILLLLIPMLSQAQSLKIYDITDKTICPGDTLNVQYTLHGSFPSQQINLLGPNLSSIWQYDYTYYSSMPHDTIQGDTVYTIKLHVKPEIGKGYGTLRNPDRPSEVFTIDMWCEFSGIEEYTSSTQYEPVYFDLMGNRIEKRTGEVIIEQRGYYRRKIYIQ